MLKKYFAREPEVNVVHTSNKVDATTAVARVIYQNTDLDMPNMPGETNAIQHRVKLTDDTAK